MTRGGGEPTEEPTPRRLEEARRRGQVALSRDLAGAVTLAAAFAALAAVGPTLAADLTGYLGRALAGAAAGGSTSAALNAAIGAASRALWLPVGAVMVAALAVNLLQTRGLVALEALQPDLGRLASATAVRRLFGGEAAAEIVKGLVKVAVVSVIAFETVRPLLPSVTALAGAAPGRVLAGFGVIAARLGMAVVVAMLVIGVGDYLLVWTRHRKSLRMTREEVKREHKEAEGDPRHRAERQRLHRDVLEQRMIADVRKADFVVVNPEHIAVALRYDRDTQAAPVVVAKGERLLAEQIKQVAREAGVPIFREVSLARALRDVQEGDEIPEALYQAVAEILRTVYQQSDPHADSRGAGSPKVTEAAPEVGSRSDIAWKRV